MVGIKVLWLHMGHLFASNTAGYITCSNRNGSVLTACGFFQLQCAQRRNFTPRFFKIYFNIILLPMSWYPKLPLTL
jgi:hypothetical protein